MRASEFELKEAYKHAVKKWRLIVENNGDPSGLTDEEYKCKYCTLFDQDLCLGCPLRPRPQTGRLGCNEVGHPWSIWYRCRDKKTAKAVLDLILKTKPF